ncbi:hypothetical protein AA313_de0201620 [Arthrobotrys entomopaga]|nr:hypothetical protein AA313_de0201620 [Arthrobotrys entomopaga]
MSEPIRNKKLDALAGAPTPQNTPLNNAPISSHATKPQVSSIEEEDRALAAGMLAQNPQLVSMIQGRLGKLIGRSSGYIESLHPAIRRRITGLKGVQKEHSKLEAEFQEEVLQLEKKYFAKFQPLYEKRLRIVNGVEEPTEADVAAGTTEGEEIEEDTKMDEDTGAPGKGIPEFWLSAMKNSTSLAETVTDRDEAALKHLTDIRMEYLERPGFRLIFEFEENEFFTNKTITKTYYYQEENGYGGDFIYDHAEGDKIDWKAGKDLTVRIESKKQRNKNTKQTRIVKRTVPVESFFNFFTPPKPPGSEDGSNADDEEELEHRLELDYTLGEDIKEKLIPRAIDWYTGEALQFEEIEDMDEGEFDDEDDDDEEASDDDRDEDEEDSDEEDESGRPKQAEAAECKQS